MINVVVVSLRKPGWLESQTSTFAHKQPRVQLPDLWRRVAIRTAVRQVLLMNRTTPVKYGFCLIITNDTIKTRTLGMILRFLQSAARQAPVRIIGLSESFGRQRKNSINDVDAPNSLDTRPGARAASGVSLTGNGDRINVGRAY